jgi:hypothetical protein
VYKRELHKLSRVGLFNFPRFRRLADAQRLVAKLEQAQREVEDPQLFVRPVDAAEVELEGQRTAMREATIGGSAG